MTAIFLFILAVGVFFWWLEESEAGQGWYHNSWIGKKLDRLAENMWN